MQPGQWHPPVALSEQEEQIVARRRRAKLCVFLRHHRHELFDESFRTANRRTSTDHASEGTRPLLPPNWR
jgi:hypothetical protein